MVVPIGSAEHTKNTTDDLLVLLNRGKEACKEKQKLAEKTYLENMIEAVRSGDMKTFSEYKDRFETYQKNSRKERGEADKVTYTETPETGHQRVYEDEILDPPPTNVTLNPNKDIDEQLKGYEFDQEAKDEFPNP